MPVRSFVSMVRRFSGYRWSFNSTEQCVGDHATTLSLTHRMYLNPREFVLLG